MGQELCVGEKRLILEKKNPFNGKVMVYYKYYATTLWLSSDLACNMREQRVALFFAAQTAIMGKRNFQNLVENIKIAW